MQGNGLVLDILFSDLKKEKSVPVSSALLNLGISETRYDKLVMI